LPVRNVDVPLLVHVEPAQLAPAALCFRRHPRDVFVAATIFEHYHFAGVRQRGVEVALRIDSQALGGVRQLGRNPRFELRRRGRRIYAKQREDGNQKDETLPPIRA
jgi:hypothetical protein